MTRLFRRVAALLHARRLDRDLDKEIAAHLELAERDALARGLSVEDARREVRQAFGGVDAVREAHRDARSMRSIEALWRDVRYVIRGLARTPMVCATVVLVLGVAIGANVAMFTTLRSIVLRPLPYADADDLVIVMHDGRNPVSYANFEAWRREARAFSAMGAAEYWRTNVGLDDGVERVLGLRVTRETLPLLGVTPLYGRLPGPEAFDEGDGRQVVISHRLWQARFGSDPHAVGRTIRLDGDPYTVVAVMPAGFVFAPFWAVDAQLWAPLPIPGLADRTSNSLRIFARLAPGTSLGRAQSEIDAITARLEAIAPATNRNVRVVPLEERVVGDTRLSLLVFMAGVGVVLVIACANVAHMLLARAATRRREVAVRLALGATRGQIIRQFLVESIVLAGVGAGLGVVLAEVGVRALVAWAPPDLPRANDIHTDGVVLLFTIALAVAAGVSFGLVPALQAARPEPGEHLAAGRGASADRRQSRVWQALMISEVALSLVLVAAAGLMLRSFAALQSDDPGFDPSGVLALSVSVEGSPNADPARRAAFFTELTERLAAMPGAAAVSAINHLPLESGSPNAEAGYTDFVSFFDRLKSSLQKTKDQLFGAFEESPAPAAGSGAAAVGTRTRRIESADALEEALITCDVGVAATDRIVASVRRKARRGDDLLPLVREEILSILQGAAPPPATGAHPRVVLIVGVNGTGKTTSIGKLANLLKQEGQKPLVCAADTFRAAAVEQLEIWTRRAEVGFIRAQPNSDPAAVVFDAIQSAKARQLDPVLVDTAGRLHTRVNLMNELDKIKRVAAREVEGAPHEVLLVLDATVGQNGVAQAREFMKVSGVNGIILTKLDGTAKGGVAVAIAQDLRLPIRYVGTGEQIDDLVPFNPREYVDALFEEAW